MEAHRRVQSVAKFVLGQLGPTIRSADTEQSIARRCVEMLAAHGITETWYYDCPALVLLGSRSCLSISGRDYRPGDEAVGRSNLITVDLSPRRDGVWGDCARSFVVANGEWSEPPCEGEHAVGFHAVESLHRKMRSFVSPDSTFADLFRFAAAEVAALGFENLDSQGNFGHSIESDLNQRRYIELENEFRLAAVPAFTFEPHIRTIGGRWGYKHENIYYFDSAGVVCEL